VSPAFVGPENPLVLASASPRRVSLLSQVGLPFVSVTSGIEESILPGGPLEEARRLAREKALAVRAAHKNSWILGADTVVVLGERVLGKPVDREDARSMLERLSGREHSVITGFSIAGPSGVEHADAVATLVRFKSLTRLEVDGYVATGEPFGKAGAYAIQGLGVFMVESITGSYSNVVGLPLCEVIQALLRAGALESFPMK